jgi:hypothetical protein
MAACFCGSRWGCRYCAAQALYLIEQYLNGLKPANIPFEQLIKFQFIINLKAAKQIGVTIPRMLMGSRLALQQMCDRKTWLFQVALNSIHHRRNAVASIAALARSREAEISSTL